MRCNYWEHLHLLENGLEDGNVPRCYPSIVGTDAVQLSQEVTNYMRVIYAIQVVLVNDLRKFIATRLPPEQFKNMILKDHGFFEQLPTYVKMNINQCHEQGYTRFSLSLMNKIITDRYLRIEKLSLSIRAILEEKNKATFRGNLTLTDKELMENFRHLKQIAKDLDILKLQMNLPTGNLVATLKYYKTCCMDEQISSWYHKSLIDLAEKEHQFGTSRHFPNQERTTRFWYLPDLSAKKLPETTPIDPGSQYVLIGNAFEETLSQILRELLSHVVPRCLLFTKIFCSQHSKYFSAEEYLLFLESQKNGYLDFDTMLLASVMLCLKKTKDTPFLEKIRETKHELLKKEKKELMENETRQYFSFFKDVATTVEKILLKPKERFASLFEELENLLIEGGEQLKVLFANLVEKAQKQQKPIWMESKNIVQTSSLLDSKEFYELLETGSYISYENRLYLGGPSNAGKTSLACILTGDEVPNKWISTNGLQIYFGQNGIHLKDKKMIPIRKGMLCHTVHRKVISAINETHNKDATPNPNVIKVEKKETVPTDHNVQKSISKRKLEDEKLHLKKISKKRFDKDQRRKLDHTTKITESKSDIKFDKIPPIKDNEIEGPSKSAAKNPKMSKEEEEETQMKIVEKNNPSSQISKSSSSSKTLNVLQEETLRKSILDDVRNKKYNLEIAPSDLVDFGGQKAFDMTHQLFILQEGTVLLLFDGSKDLNEPLPEYPGQIISSAVILLHWVDSVSTYCTEESGMHRIQFVATHSDRYQDNFEIRRKELVTQLAATFQKHEKKLDLCFDNLFFIDARNKDDNEIDKLKDKLVQVAFSQKSWGKKMPLLWVPLEKQIVDLKLRGTSILRIEEIQKLNKSNEDLMMDDEQLNYFLRTQHAIGKLVFFDEGELAEFVIIEPSVLVNALRSFVTDEIFFPQQDRECYNILKKLQKEGMLKKIDLMKLWNQDEFQVIFPTQGFKDFLVKILIHLDVLVKPPLGNQDVSFSEEYYIVPSMVQNRFDNDYVETYLNRSRSICMSYVFKLNMAPPCVLFRVIAAAVGIFHLKDYKKQKMIFQNVATFCFDEENEFSIIKEGNRIIVYFTNANSTRKIQQSKVASVQEWLTTVISSILEFYQLHSRGVNLLHKTNYGDPFELEYGAACQRHACFVNNEEEIMRSKAGMWKCRHDLLHEVDYLWYWDSKKFEENIKISVSEIDLSQTVLMKKPTTELFRKLSFELGTNGTRLGESLGMNNSEIENNIIVNKYNVFEETRNILDYWEKSSDSVTIAVLVKALENIGSRGLLTIAKYFSHKPVKRCRSKSVPFLLSTKEDLTDEKDWFFKLKISCDKYDMHLIIDHNLQTKYKSLSETVNQTVPVYIKSITGKKLIVQIDRSSTIFDLKHAIQDQIGFPPDRLLHAQRQLENDKTLDDYGITAGATLYMVVSVRGGGYVPEQWIEVGSEKYDIEDSSTSSEECQDSSINEVISQQKRGTKRKRQDIEDSPTSSEECHDSSINEDIEDSSTSSEECHDSSINEDIEDSSTSSEECHDSSINEDISTEGLKSVKPNQSVFELIYKQTSYKKRSIISVGNLHENQDLLYRFILARNLCPSDVLYILLKAMDNKKSVISKAFSWYFLRSTIKQTNLSEFFSRVNDIWPGFVCRCKKDKKGHSDICSNEPVIVIDADEYLKDLQKEIYGIPVRQSADYVKKENTEDKSDTFIEESSIPTIVPTISGEKVERLFLQHTKLTLVYTSINEPGYVQLGCQFKGIIPMGEEHLPVVVCSMNTKILHGHVSFLTKMYVGSKIGRVMKKTPDGTPLITSSGTLGGFVNRRGRKAFLTCSHVIYDRETLLSANKRDKYKDEIRVHCYSNNNAARFDCGIVIDDVFEYDYKDRPSVDAAVISLDNNGSEIDENKMIDSGQDRWLQPGFLGMKSPYIDENYKTIENRKGVMKARIAGAISGYIERDVIFEDYDKIKENFKDKTTMHGVPAKWEDISEQFEKVKTMNPKPLSVSTDAHFQTKLITKLGEEEEQNPRFVRFYHQLLMENLPFKKGDSGTCIYIVEDKSKESNDENSTGCIGMAIADFTDSKGKKKVIVTPMEAILDALRLI